MYDRHIEVKKNWVFINENDCIEMDLTNKFPEEIVFYVEEYGDWWIEKYPFTGREKNEQIRQIALLVLEKAEKIWAERLKVQEE